MSNVQHPTPTRSVTRTELLVRDSLTEDAGSSVVVCETRSNDIEFFYQLQI